jgi:predicted nucleic acid-binding protein
MPRDCWRLCSKTVQRTDESGFEPQATGVVLKYWDASAIAPLLAHEPTRGYLLRLLDQDADMLVWWGTPVELASALARREREGLLTADEVTAALNTAHALAGSWHEIAPSDSIRRTAERLLRAHPLRAGDSLQLAAAVIASDHDPPSLEFVCMDVRLARAAQREGFVVIGQSPPGQ